MYCVCTLLLILKYEAEIFQLLDVDRDCLAEYIEYEIGTCDDQFYSTICFR